MARFFVSATPFDTLLERATSETLTTDDMEANLQLCDLIRSKEVTAPVAVKSLKKRLGHPNPNVQMWTLKVLEMCAKNCGHHFHVEIVSKDFMDVLQSLINYRPGMNNDVRMKALELIQEWGLAFRDMPDLFYAVQVYNMLSNQGVQFPPRNQSSGIMLDTATAPEWSDSEYCMRCRNPFSVYRRKHHCRNCGQAFCWECSSKTMPLLQFGIEKEVRVCDGCYESKRGSSFSASPAGAATASPASALSGAGTTSIPFPGSASSPSFGYTGLGSAFPESSFYSGNAPVHPTATSFDSFGAKRDSSSEDQFEADLKRALELSKSEGSTTSTISPSSSTVKPKSRSPPASSSDDEDDAELAAAIAASLKDVTIQPKSQSTALSDPAKSTSGSSLSSSSKSPAEKRASTDEDALTLSDAEKSNIQLFAKLIYKIEQNGDSVRANLEVQRLHDQILGLYPKLLNDLETINKRHQHYLEQKQLLEDSLNLYQQLLDERLKYVYRRSQLPPLPVATTTSPARSFSPPAPQAVYGQQAPYAAPPMNNTYGVPTSPQQQQQRQPLPPQQQQQFPPSRQVQYSAPPPQQQQQQHYQRPGPPPSLQQSQQPVMMMSAPPPPPQLQQPQPLAAQQQQWQPPAQMMPQQMMQQEMYHQGPPPQHLQQQQSVPASQQQYPPPNGSPVVYDASYTTTSPPSKSLIDL